MERLTMKTPDGYMLLDPIDIVDNKYSKINFDKVTSKLGYYEDLAEQGRLVELPCKVGDTVYSVVEDGLMIFELKFSLDFYVRRMSDFGKTIFLTREEAEQALAEMKEV